MKGPNSQYRPCEAIGCAVHVAKVATGVLAEATCQVPGRMRSGRRGDAARR